MVNLSFGSQIKYLGEREENREREGRKKRKAPLINTHGVLKMLEGGEERKRRSSMGSLGGIGES